MRRGRVAWIAGRVLVLLLLGGGGAWGFTAARGERLAEQVNGAAIHSVHMGLEGWPLAPPILRLDQMGALLFTFDEVEAPSRGYDYTLVHCDAAWRVSDLLPSDYIEGFAVNSLPFAQLSIATTTPFAHYALRIPNREVRPTLSGNYALVVFRPEEPDRPVVVRHFMVLDPLAAMTLRLHRVPGGQRVTHQRLEVRVEVGRLGHAQSVGAGLTVITRQNWYTACQRVHTRPSAYEGGHALIYGNAFEGIWPGGNEWRMLNLQSVRVPVDRAERIDLTEEGYHVGLRVDVSLAHEPYMGPDDLDGYWALGYAGDWKRARGANGYEPLESDYAWVYFTYRDGAPRADAPTTYLQIAGLGTGYAGVPMRYNAGEGQHEARLRLKQGVYSYRYLQAPDLLPADGEGGGCLSPCATEGCHYAARHEYHALAYYRYPGERYDRLVGWEMAR